MISGFDSRFAFECVTWTSKKASCCRVQKPLALISRRASGLLFFLTAPRPQREEAVAPPLHLEGHRASHQL